MSLTRLAGENSGVSATDLHIERRLRDHDPNLVEVTAGEKGGKATEPRSVSKRGHSGGNAGHVLLGNAHFEEAIGIALRKNICPRGIGQIAVQHHCVGPSSGKLAKRLTPHFPKGGGLPWL